MDECGLGFRDESGSGLGIKFYTFRSNFTLFRSNFTCLGNISILIHCQKIFFYWK